MGKIFFLWKIDTDTAPADQAKASVEEMQMSRDATRGIRMLQNESVNDNDLVFHL